MSSPASDDSGASWRSPCARRKSAAAGIAATDVKARIDLQVTPLQGDVKSAEAKLTEMKQATAVRWKEFEAGVNAAIARLHKSIETATG